jgi:deoxyribodipyrimidine photo-lyase
LQAAIENDEPILPLYILDDQSAGIWANGAASRWWLHYALQSLHERLARYGAELYFFSGNTTQILVEICSLNQVKNIYCHAANEPWAREQQIRLKEALQNLGVTLRLFRSNELVDPDLLLNNQQQPYRVFSPFWRAASQQLFPKAKRTLVEKAEWKTQKISNGESLDQLRLLPDINWDKGFHDLWQPDEKGLKHNLRLIKKNIADYAEKRDFPANKVTSRLSPYLAFGQVSPARVLDFVGMDRQSSRFVAELGWREFSRYLLYHFPESPEQALNKKYQAFPWVLDESAFNLWCKGETGYPIVDAGMRELWRSGWMHNRVRMIAASFLVKHLLIDWKKGAQWFWQTLLDADLANNTQGWQWIAGSGVDAAPYFRIFNPVVQSKKFDAEGVYIRQWIPELSDLPDKYIHEPWAAPREVLETCGIQLGEDYPFPIVDLKFGRERALEALKQIS